MSAKKKNKKSSIIDPTSESIALGSAFSVLFLVFLKSFIVAALLGGVFAFTHWKGVTKRKTAKK